MLSGTLNSLLLRTCVVDSCQLNAICICKRLKKKIVSMLITHNRLNRVGVTNLMLRQAGNE